MYNYVKVFAMINLCQG